MIAALNGFLARLQGEFVPAERTDIGGVTHAAPFGASGKGHHSGMGRIKSSVSGILFRTFLQK
jgi:hypothetical protein